MPIEDRILAGRLVYLLLAVADQSTGGYMVLRRTHPKLNTVEWRINVRYANYEHTSTGTHRLSREALVRALDRANQWLQTARASIEFAIDKMDKGG